MSHHFKIRFIIRMRRIIVHGLHLQFNTLVATIRGWSKEPMVNEIENILANQEALDKRQTSELLVDKDEKLSSVIKGY